MKKIFLMLFVLGLVTACQPNNGDQVSSSSQPVVSTNTDTNADANDQVPVEASTFETNISTVGMSVDQEEEIRKAEDIIKLVVSSEEFKKRVLNHTVNGVKTFLNNNGLTNAEIYQKILDAAEDGTLNKDNIMDLAVELIPQKSTLASRIFKIIAGIKKIFFFLNLFQNTTPAGIAQNLFQQWLGKLGFSTVTGSTSHLTVQEAIAKIIGELGQQYI